MATMALWQGQASTLKGERAGSRLFDIGR